MSCELIIPAVSVMALSPPSPRAPFQLLCGDKQRPYSLMGHSAVLVAEKLTLLKSPTKKRPPFSSLMSVFSQKETQEEDTKLNLIETLFVVLTFLSVSRARTNCPTKWPSNGGREERELVGLSELKPRSPNLPQCWGAEGSILFSCPPLGSTPHMPQGWKGN